MRRFKAAQLVCFSIRTVDAFPHNASTNGSLRKAAPVRLLSVHTFTSNVWC